jgi:hypothetical protein
MALSTARGGSDGRRRRIEALQAHDAEQRERFGARALHRGGVDDEHQVGAVGAEHVAVDFDRPDECVLEDLVVAGMRRRRALFPKLGEPLACRLQVRDESAQVRIIRIVPDREVQVCDEFAFEREPLRTPG